jgi:hypothetical protein
MSDNEEPNNKKPLSVGNSFKESIFEEPESVSALAQASVFFTQGLLEKAEPLFRSIPKSFSKYHVAVSGLFNLLWLKNTPASKREAMQLIDVFLKEADRNDAEIKPVVANFLKIKIELLKNDEWLK